MGPRMRGEWEMLPRRPRRLVGFWGRVKGGAHAQGGGVLGTLKNHSDQRIHFRELRVSGRFGGWR